MKLYINGRLATAALCSVSLQKDRREAAHTLTAAVWIAAADTYALKLSPAVGDPVQLLDDGGNEIFLGAVYTLQRTPELVSLTAYDRGIYLTGNELHGVFAGTGKQVVQQVAQKLSLSVGTLDLPEGRHHITALAGRSAFSILRQAAGEEREISLRDGVLTVTRPAGTPASLAPERILSVSAHADVTPMINRSVVISRNGQTLAAAQDAAAIQRYGQFQAVWQKAGDSPAQLAQSKLKTKVMSAEIVTEGDLSLACGCRVRAAAPNWGLNGIYAVTAANHRWEDGLFTTELSLEEVDA